MDELYHSVENRIYYTTNTGEEQLFLTVHPTNNCYSLEEQAKRIVQILNDLD